MCDPMELKKKFIISIGFYLFSRSLFLRPPLVVTNEKLLHFYRPGMPQAAGFVWILAVALLIPTFVISLFGLITTEEHIHRYTDIALQSFKCGHCGHSNERE
jgi:hypothetical protein